MDKGKNYISKHACKFPKGNGGIGMHDVPKGMTWSVEEVRNGIMIMESHAASIMVREKQFADCFDEAV